MCWIIDEIFVMGEREGGGSGGRVGQGQRAMENTKIDFYLEENSKGNDFINLFYFLKIFPKIFFGLP